VVPPLARAVYAVRNAIVVISAALAGARAAINVTCTASIPQNSGYSLLEEFEKFVATLDKPDENEYIPGIGYVPKIKSLVASIGMELERW
jgi:hypothetical protein